MKACIIVIAIIIHYGYLDQVEITKDIAGALDMSLVIQVGAKASLTFLFSFFFPNCCLCLLAFLA